jgi:hypothetical protein
MRPCFFSSSSSSPTTRHSWLRERSFTRPTAASARPEDHHRRALLAAAPVQRPLLERAVAHARERHERDQQKGIEEVFAHSERAVHAGGADRHRDRDRAGEDREDDALDVGQARVAPDALVDAEEHVDRDLDRDRDRERGEQEIEALRAQHGRVQERGGREHGSREREGVVERGSKGACVDVHRLHHGIQGLFEDLLVAPFTPFFFLATRSRWR